MEKINHSTPIIGIILTIITFSPQRLLAFDGDYMIQEPDFVEDNFIDIKAYQPNQLRQREWNQTLNGLRIVEGTLDMNFTYLELELRLQQNINSILTLSYHMKHHEFYGIKPLRQQLEFQLHLQQYVHLSIVGFPAYDKRTGDLGGAITLGVPDETTLRFERIAQDVYYNEKNFETDRYITPPIEDRISVTVNLKPDLRFWADVLLEHPMEQFFPETDMNFNAEGKTVEWRLEHFLSDYEVWGLNHKEEVSEKSWNASNSEEASQKIKFLSAEFFWIQQAPFFNNVPLIAGTQFDHFENKVKPKNHELPEYNYSLTTWQIYSFFIHHWNPELDWEYAFFFGEVNETKDYESDVTEDINKYGLEHAFRLSWEWHSSDHHSSLTFISSWSLDELKNTAWDGGGTTVQIKY
ncbi:hypothetical protein WDW89_18050 [Deltaproteobacteria bacterium TL4]